MFFYQLREVVETGCCGNVFSLGSEMREREEGTDGKCEKGEAENHADVAEGWENPHLENKQEYGELRGTSNGLQSCKEVVVEYAGAETFWIWRCVMT